MALVLLAAAAATASADTLVATAQCPPAGPGTTVAPNGCTGVSAHRGRIVWSTHDPSTGRYALMTAAGGNVGPVAVAQRATPFDADLGHDARGRVVATYSRCARDPDGPPTGCAVREYAFAADESERELLPGVGDPDPLLPSRWGDRVAVARRTSAGATLRRALLCSAAGEPACRPLPGGPAGGATGNLHGPIALDIDARRVAMGWLSYDGTRNHAILVAAFDAAIATTIEAVRAGLAGNAAVHSPALDGGYVYYARGGASCDYGAPPNSTGRYDLARRTSQEVSTPALAGLAVDAGAVVYAACGRFASGADQLGTTLVERAAPPPFDRPGALDPARAAGCPARRTAADWSLRTIARPAALFMLGLAGTGDGRALALWPAKAVLGLAVRGRRGSFGGVRRIGVDVGGDLRSASDDAGHVAIAWSTRSAGTTIVKAATGTVDGDVSAPQTLARQRGPIVPTLASVAVAPDGGSIVAWTELPPPSGGDPSLLVAFRAPGAARFGTPARLRTGPALTRVLAVAAASGGRALVAMTGYVGGQVVVADATAAGFGAPALLQPSGAPVVGGAASSADGAATLAWATRQAVQTSTRRAGSSFGAPRTISTAGTPVASMSLDTHRSRLALAWGERDVRNTLARMTIAEGQVGSPLAAAHVLGLGRGRVDEVRVALGAGGAATLAWKLSCRSDGARVVAVSRRRRSAPFGTQTVVSRRDREAYALAVALGRGGRPTVGWVTLLRDPPNVLVRLAALDR